MSGDITPKKRVTIKDIARETGFTAQTVSLALRNKECITKKTREIVNETARRLGYIKNDMAINLRNGRTNTIAIVYDDITNPYFSIMTRYLQSYFRAQGYVLLIFTADSYFLDQETFYNILSCNVAGVVSFLDIDENIANLSICKDSSPSSCQYRKQGHQPQSCYQCRSIIVSHHVCVAV